MLARLPPSPSRRAGRLGLPASPSAPSAEGGAGSARRPRDPPLSPVAPLGRRPTLATNFAQVSCAGAAAPLLARSPRSLRPGVRRRRGPSLLLSQVRAEQAREPRYWRRGFKENAPSPQFEGPRWGRSGFPHFRSGVGPFPTQATTPPILEGSGALCEVSGSQYYIE
ncbi:uncharacterized protein PS065_019119 isoform 2-T2 [Dugong dugon]